MSGADTYSHEWFRPHRLDPSSRQLTQSLETCHVTDKKLQRNVGGEIADTRARLARYAQCGESPTTDRHAWVARLARLKSWTVQAFREECIALNSTIIKRDGLESLR